MRFLNKVTFINSAAIKYAEIALNGNVHFIGTQGVGKSTILRAILFFYNADSRKLGVPTGPSKKIFVEYYFPYANSFIVYEIQRETGPYCLLAFKSQNRVCFRFIDRAYDRRYFIDSEGRAFDAWGKTRALLDADRIQYSRQIKHYEEYKDIIYGNNDGKREFKKYALLESKQYINIPRTIQNVFLNTKLEAEFIKQTIIMSLNEDDVTIDLQNYSHHLENFENQLADIKRFRYPSVQKHAHSAIDLFVAIQHLKKEKIKLAEQLSWALHNIEEKEPFLLDRLKDEQIRFRSLQEKQSKEQALSQKRKVRFWGQIKVLDNKLKESKKKAEAYERIGIHQIILRVQKKSDIETEKQNLLKEKELLSSKFTEITQKYEALLAELQNQFDSYLNSKGREKLELQESFHNKKDEITTLYEALCTEIRNEHGKEVSARQEELSEKHAHIFHLKNKKVEIRHKRYYENEIQLLKDQISLFETEMDRGNNRIGNFQEQIETLQKRWELEKKSVRESYERNKEIVGEKIERLKAEAVSITQKIENYKNSFYGWLNENIPGWEITIGKVCSEGVLFQHHLSPKLSVEGRCNFYGVDIDLEEIDKTSKTIADYEYEYAKLEELLRQLKTESIMLTEGLEADLGKVRNRILPKIRALKESIRETEYSTQQATLKKQQAKVELNDFIEKAEHEKSQALRIIETDIGDAIEEQVSAEERLNSIKHQIERKIKLKQRERDRNISEIQKNVESERAKIDSEIATTQKASNNRQVEIRLQRDQELDNKGADTTRLTAIDQRLTKADAELNFIEANRDKVAEYRKDKRELFDRVGEFKNEKQLLEQQLEQEIQRLKKFISALEKDIEAVNGLISKTKMQLAYMKEDREEFSKFQLSETYKSIEGLMLSANEMQQTQQQRPRDLIAKINETFYKVIDRERELRETIDKFLGNFSAYNILNFKTNLVSMEEYIIFAEELIDFIEEDKISEYEKRVNERFASIVASIGKETTELISRTGEIQKIVRKINADFMEKNFVGAVKKIELRVDDSANSVVVVLKSLKAFNDENMLNFGEANLFSNQDKDANNKKAIELLKQLVKEIDASKRDHISLSDSFELKFRVEENQNDTDWVEKLSNVGSDGTDVLVKAMVNIMLLNVFKEGASKRFKDFRLHCMMDEVGKLHPNNVKGILKFANDRNIVLINGSPTENNPLSYKHIYKFEKDSQSITKVKRIISNFT